METTRLQELFWMAHTLNDKLFALEARMRRIVGQGKSCVKTQNRYYELLDELREVNAEMLLIES
jgi:hypothetical protein